MTTETLAFVSGRNAFVPGWTNHLEHNPYQKGTVEHQDFAKGWDSQAATSEHGLDIE